MNLPNKLTVSRLFLTVIFTFFLLADFRTEGMFWKGGFYFSNMIALAVFIVAMVTDWLDGKLARDRKLQTSFGALMDPVADKVMVSAAFVCFIYLNELGRFGPWAVIIIITREFLITGLRLLAGAEHKVLAADRLGKHKTAWQMITILIVLIKMTCDEVNSGMEDSAAIGWLLNNLSMMSKVALTITVILTVYSGVAYLYKNRDLWLKNS